MKKSKVFTKDDLVLKFIQVNEKTNLFMERVSNVLVQLNDNNKLHKEAINANTDATKELVKSFNRIWTVFFIIILALVVLAGAEKILKFL